MLIQGGKGPFSYHKTAIGSWLHTTSSANQLPNKNVPIRSWHHSAQCTYPRCSRGCGRWSWPRPCPWPGRRREVPAFLVLPGKAGRRCPCSWREAPAAALGKGAGAGEAGALEPREPWAGAPPRWTGLLSPALRSRCPADFACVTVGSPAARAGG